MTKRKRLTKKEVEEVKKLHSQGIYQKEIAKMFNTSQSSICMLLNGQTYTKKISEKYNITEMTEYGRKPKKRTKNGVVYTLEEYREIVRKRKKDEKNKKEQES